MGGVPTLLDYVIWRTHVGRMILFESNGWEEFQPLALKYRIPVDLVERIWSKCNTDNFVCRRCLQVYVYPRDRNHDCFNYFACYYCLSLKTQSYCQCNKTTSTKRAHRLFALWNNERWDLEFLKQEAQWWRKHSKDVIQFRNRTKRRYRLKNRNRFNREFNNELCNQWYCKCIQFGFWKPRGNNWKKIKRLTFTRCNIPKHCDEKYLSTTQMSPGNHHSLRVLGQLFDTSSN